MDISNNKHVKWAASVFGAFIGFEKIGDDIRKEAASLFVRADVPRSDIVPEDLRDKSPNFINTANGYRQSGRMLAQDIKQGSSSPAMAILLTVIIFAMYFLSSMSQVFFDKSVGQIMAFGGAALILYGLLSVVVTLNLRLSLLYVAVGVLFALSGAISIYASVLGISAGLVSYILFAIPAGLPKLIHNWQRNQRAMALAKQSINKTGEDNYERLTESTKSRMTQFKTAYLDQKKGHTFMPLGTYKGVMSKSLSPFVPDAGQIAGYSTKDAEAPTLSLGSPGTGKTTQARVVIDHYSKIPSMGMLIQDGKGVLAHEAKARLDYVIDHTTVYNPMEGLLPHEVAGRIAAKHKTTGDKNPFFTNNQQLSLRHGCEFLTFIEEQKLKEWNYNIAGLMEIVKIFEDKKSTITFCVSLREEVEKANKRALTQALEWAESLENLAEETRGSIFSGTRVWLEEFFADPDLSAWCYCVKSEVSIDEVFTARKRLGVAIGSNYGETGVANLLLMTAQFWKKLKATKHGKGTYNRFLWIIDEAPSVLKFSNDGFGHQTIVEQGRSLGANFFIMMQNIQQVGAMARNQAEADGFISLFRNYICFNPNDDHTFKHIQAIMGEAPVNHVTSGNSASINFLATARSAARSAVFDEEHPDYDVMRNNMFLLNTNIKSGKERDDEPLIVNNPISEQSMKPVLTKADWYHNLNMQNVALGIFIRGDVKRFDFFKPVAMGDDFEVITYAGDIELDDDIFKEQV